MSDFNAVIGEDTLINQMKNIANGGKVSHAYVIIGERFSGKTTLAGCFAKALMCESEGKKPCGMCLSCLQVDEGSHPDVKYVMHENPDIIGVEDIRKNVKDDIVMKPYQGGRKIYIIDDAHKMTVQAQNALLKTLEEPPEYAVIILTVTQPEALLTTIQSRTVSLPIRPVPDETLKRYLMAKERIPDYKADICAAFARGNLGRAVNLVEDADFDDYKNETIDFLKGIGKADLGVLYAKARDLNKEKKEKKENKQSATTGINDFLEFILIWYRDGLVYKSAKSAEGLIFKEEIQYIKKVLKEISYEDYEEIFAGIETTKEMLRNNVNAETALGVLLLTLKKCSAKKDEL